MRVSVETTSRRAIEYIRNVPGNKHELTSHAQNPEQQPFAPEKSQDCGLVETCCQTQERSNMAEL